MLVCYNPILRCEIPPTNRTETGTQKWTNPLPNQGGALDYDVFLGILHAMATSQAGIKPVLSPDVDLGPLKQTWLCA